MEKQTLFVSHKVFTEMLLDLISSGVAFTSKEENGGIMVTFTGGY